MAPLTTLLLDGKRFITSEDDISVCASSGMQLRWYNAAAAYNALYAIISNNGAPQRKLYTPNIVPGLLKSSGPFD